MKDVKLNRQLKDFTNEEKQKLKKRKGKDIIGHAKNGKEEVYFYSDGTKEEVKND